MEAYINNILALEPVPESNLLKESPSDTQRGMKLTPSEFLSKLAPYAGSLSFNEWLDHAAVGLGVVNYQYALVAAGPFESLNILLTELAEGDIKVVKSTSKVLTDEFSADKKVYGMHILNERIIAIISPYGSKNFMCFFMFFWTDATEAEKEAFKRFKLRETSKQDTSQLMYMLIDYGMGDFNFHSNKIPASVFKTENYSDINVEWLTKLRKGLFTPNSTGRLTIFQGPPGTGKTRYLRSLIMDQPDVVPIVLPVSLATELSQPRMLGQIIANEEFENKNLLVIIEDGDSLLEKREHSASIISEFLNIIDGLVGEIVNLHVIVTTNLQKKDFDSAIMRPGRLHSILYFESLKYEQAAKVYLRETGCELPRNKEEYSLAEIYALTNSHVNGVKEKTSSGSGQYL